VRGLSPYAFTLPPMSARLHTSITNAAVGGTPAGADGAGTGE
jgi:hypothetical protein